MKYRHWAPALFFLVAIGLSSCAGGSPKIADSTWQYTLDAGDEIKIVVFGQEELSDTYRVSDAGAVSLPLLGVIPVKGYTTHGLESLLTKKLSSGYLRNPNVRVEMVTYRPVYILGEVKNPGKYPYEPGMTALSAAAVAGGFTYRAETKDFKVTRKFSDGHTQTGNVGAQDQVYPGDVIQVPERLF